MSASKVPDIFKGEISKEDKKFLLEHAWSKRSHYRRNSSFLLSLLVSTTAVFIAFINYYLKTAESLGDFLVFSLVSILFSCLIIIFGYSSYSAFKTSNHYQSMYSSYLETYFEDLSEELIEDYKEDKLF